MLDMTDMTDMTDSASPTPAPTAARAFVTGGALLFAVSLAVFGWFYLVGLADRAPRLAPPAAVILNALLFALFALHHSVFARSGVRVRVAHAVSPHLERATYVWTASLLLLLLCWRWAAYGAPLWDVAGPARLALRGLQALGVALSIVAASALGARSLAGLHQLRAPLPSTGIDPVDAPPRNSGLYGFVRHPIYFAWLLIVWAAPTLTPSHLQFAALSTAYLAIAIVYEERDLHARFGPAYADYIRRVRYRLVPWLY